MNDENPKRKRSYGYIPKEKSSETTKIDSKENKKQPKKGVWWIFRAIWRAFPKLSQKTKKSLWQGIFKLGLALVIFGTISGVALVAWVSRDLPNPDRLTDRHIAQSTKIYDRTGQHLLREIFTDKKRTLVDLNDIPKNVINGVIATEDTQFYTHRGIRPLSLARSFVYGLMGKGRIGGGASTLTQQLVKNAILTNERTITRKIKEFILSVRLEQVYTKDQILKIYFNEIPYGSTNYGIESAAQSYFGKHVADLNLQESATLAGLPQAPSRYLNNPESLRNRRNFVLQRMFEEGYITKQEKEEAQASPLTLSQHIGNITAPHFVFYVKDILDQEFGEKVVDTGGLKVITTLDLNKQNYAEEAVSSSQKTLLEAKADNAALVAMDPKNGQILAMVGSRDYNDLSIKGNFNVATQGQGRQPGSSMKPIIYALAFSRGYTPDTLLFDVITNFAVPPAKEYRPGNYDGKEHGLVTIRQALQNSYNVPAVQTLYLVGLKDALELTQKLGYTTISEGDFGLSLVLGGATVHLLEHTAAYATFANNGVHHTPVAVLRVEDAQGNVLKEWKQEQGEQIFDPGTTATLSNVLSDDPARAATFGAGSILTLPDRPVAAKTGTTNDYKDGWTMGYTPSLAVGVWIGRTDNAPLKPGYGGSKVAGVIWNQFMKSALANTAPEQFPTPPPNAANKPILRGALGGNITLPINKITGKIATSSTLPENIEERVYIPAHSILHYVNKEDPNGPPPINPTDDPQYSIWEAAIQDWINRQKTENPNWNTRFEDPPTEYDDPNNLSLIPTIEVLSPTPGSIIQNRNINSEIRASAPRGVSQVTYSIDGKIIDIITSAPFSLKAFIPSLENGDHTLTVTAEDDSQNRRITEVPFTLNAGIEPAVVTWTEHNLTLTTSQFPRTFFLNPYLLDQIREVRIYTNRSGDNTKNLISTINNFSNLFNGQIAIQWSAPGPGDWVLSTETILLSGGVREGDVLNIRVQ